jgi:group I intron endonuclease
MIGIYKITNPKGRIYIGQSINLEKRKENYSSLRDCKGQPRIYASLVKYGFSEHIFEVVEQCEVGELNIRERHWQDFYNVLGKVGLNCRLTKTEDRSGYCSPEVGRKVSQAKKGVKPTPAAIEANRKGQQGKKLKQSTKDRISQALLGRSRPQEVIDKIVKTSTGKKKKPHKKLECPYCKKIGGQGVIKRYHFEKCKEKVG